MCDYNAEVVDLKGSLREICYTAHDGMHRARAEPGESAIEAVVRAEIRRGEADDFTCSSDGGGLGGPSYWRIEAWSDGHFVYAAGICIDRERILEEDQ